MHPKDSRRTQPIEAQATGKYERYRAPSSAVPTDHWVATRLASNETD